MDGKMNTMKRDPMALRDSDVRKLTMKLEELREMIINAQMFWGTGGRCLLDKKAATDLIEETINRLPDSVKQASQIVGDELAIRENAQKAAEDQMNKAREEAQKIVDGAAREANATRAKNKELEDAAAAASSNAQNAASVLKSQAEKDAASIRQQAQNAANALYLQAQNEAKALVARAQQEAQMIIGQAQADARAAVSDENVYRMAVMQANELREQTEKEMASMRKSYIDWLDGMMGEVDNSLLNMVSNIRMERQNLINKQ